MNATDGSGSLRLDSESDEPVAVLTTSGNASFRIFAEVFAPSIDSEISRLEPGDGTTYGFVQALVNLSFLSPGAMGVHLNLSIGLESLCWGEILDLHKEIVEGSCSYEAELTTIVC